MCICHLQCCPCYRPCQPVLFRGLASCSGCSELMRPTPAISSESRASPAWDLPRSLGRGPKQGSYPCPLLPTASSVFSKRIPGIAPAAQTCPCSLPHRRQALLVPAAHQQRHQPHLLPQSRAETACPEVHIWGAEYPPEGEQASAAAASRSHPSLLRASASPSGKKLPA